MQIETGYGRCGYDRTIACHSLLYTGFARGVSSHGMRSDSGKILMYTMCGTEMWLHIHPSKEDDPQVGLSTEMDKFTFASIFRLHPIACCLFQFSDSRPSRSNVLTGKMVLMVDGWVMQASLFWEKRWILDDEVRHGREDKVSKRG